MNPPPDDMYGHDSSEGRQERARVTLEFDLRGLLQEIRTDVAAIRREQTEQATRITKVEGRLDTAEAVAKSKTALVGIMLTLIAALVAVGGLLITVGKL